MVNQMIRIPEGCVLWLDLTEPTGNIIYDRSGKGNNGTVYGAVLERRLPYIGRKFDGVDDYIEVINSPSLQIPNELTILAWVNLNTIIPDYQPILFKYDSAKAVGFVLWADWGTNNETRFYVAGTKTGIGINGPTLKTNTWCFIAGVYNGLTLQIYHDANLVNTQSADLGDISSTVNLLIGKTTHPYYFKGLIAHISIYNRALHPSEIKRLYEEFQRVKMRRIDALNIRMR